MKNMGFFGLGLVGGLIMGVGAQSPTPTQTAESGQLLPAQSSALDSARSTYLSGLTTYDVYPTVTSELATATSAAEDLFGVALNGDDGATLSSLLSELPSDVASWWISVTLAEASLVTSVLGTTSLPTAPSSSEVSFITTGPTSSAATKAGASKNAAPTIGAMGGVGCGVVAFGAAAACVMGML
ncbi:hypothetical protein EG329_009681 [Mollisiaceae sp. DMI_Dod_QoI]|nr:hypothetical protein EG329_009681 [Helotiales sp. DMI_Dod_QoI]